MSPYKCLLIKLTCEPKLNVMFQEPIGGAEDTAIIRVSGKAKPRILNHTLDLSNGAFD